MQRTRACRRISICLEPIQELKAFPISESHEPHQSVSAQAMSPQEVTGAGLRCKVVWGADDLVVVKSTAAGL